MNRIYRLVWSHVTNGWVCCAETAKGRGKSSGVCGSATRKFGAQPDLRMTVLAASLALIGTSAFAAPVGGQVSAGSGSIAQSGTNTTINQSSQNLAINWQSFGIAANESVRFNQPNASAIVLNRVTGQNPSTILGSLSANGQVFVLNPNGILFGAGSQVNVGGLVATTLNLSDADFMAGKNTFSGTGGSVINQGSLTAVQGGYIALLAPEVRNEGVISAQLGTALLAAGDKVTLNLNSGSLLGYSIDQGALKALAENKQLIQADGGQVLMSARAADALSTAVVNNTGIIQARSIQNIGGTIKLIGDMQTGAVQVSGTLDASAPNGGNGGFIETSAAHVHVTDNARVTTLAANGLAGTWLIDPVDFTIAASGGDMTGAAVSTALAGGNFSILSTSGAAGTSGNINVNDAVSWSANTLTLNAQNNININAAMNASGTASLALQYGQGAVAAGNTSNIITGANGVVNLPAGTTNFTTKQGSDGAVTSYTVITALGVAGDATVAPATMTLQGMATGLTANYVLGANIDATATSTWNAGAGFTRVGNIAPSFTGIFDGLGHTISNLTINLPTTNYVGLFGYVSGAAIRNVRMVGGSVSGAGYVGGLVGLNRLGTISNSSIAGAVSGTGGVVGGLVGYNYSGTVSNSSASTNVSATTGNSVGGLVGSNSGTVSNCSASGSVSTTTGPYVGGLVGNSSSTSTISNSSASGTVSSTSGSRIGGLAGLNYGAISASSASGNVGITTGGMGGQGLVGGLVGYNNNGTISGSSASGNVSSTSGTNLGGLVGQNTGGTISASYATGIVSSTSGSYLGGLVGRMASGTISNSYSTGNVSSAGSFVGGLVGSGTVTNSYYNLDTVTVNGAKPVGVYGLYTNQFIDWKNNGFSLNPVTYFGAATATNTYTVTGVQGLKDLLGFSNNAALTFTLAGNIDMSAAPAGFYIPTWAGTFDGAGKTISNFTLNSSNSNIGLFGRALTGSTIKNLSLVNANVTGVGNVGALVGASYGTISNSSASGTVSGTTGGNVGGLVGYNYGNTSKIINSYATGSVSSTTGSFVGGLAGNNSMGSISNSYATGRVSSTSGAKVGGLAGNNSGTISNSYATGNVSSAGTAVGGLVGNSTGTLTADFWDVTKSGNAAGVGTGTATGATGLTTAQMQTQSSFTPAGTGAGNWDFTNTWILFAGQSNPLLQALMTPLTVTANNSTKTYDGLAYNGSAGVTYSVTPNMSNLSGTLSYTGGINAGSYTITPSGLSSYVQQGYLITYATGTLTVNKASLTVSGISASNKVYDGTTAATLTGTAIVTALGSDVVTVGGTGVGAFADANVGTGKAVTVSGYTLGGAAAGNYTIVQPTGLTANITAAPASTTTTSTTTTSGISPALAQAIEKLFATSSATEIANLSNAFVNAKAAATPPVVVVSNSFAAPMFMAPVALPVAAPNAQPVNAVVVSNTQSVNAVEGGTPPALGQKSGPATEPTSARSEETGAVKTGTAHAQSGTQASAVVASVEPVSIQQIGMLSVSNDGVKLPEGMMKSFDGEKGSLNNKGKR